MRITVAIGASRYPQMMTSEEIEQALHHARTLAAMRPPLETSRHLALFIGELLTALWQRGEAEAGERPITEFSRKELRDILAHAKALRLLQPRQQIQACALDLMFAATAELENRSNANADHAARVAKSLTDGCSPNTSGQVDDNFGHANTRDDPD
jgi:hypothetical protein